MANQRLPVLQNKRCRTRSVTASSDDCGLGRLGSDDFLLTCSLSAFRRQFVRVNQDELGNRRRCEEKARLALLANKCPVIDRCNFDESQRLKWFQLVRDVQKHKRRPEQSEEQSSFQRTDSIGRGREGAMQEPMVPTGNTSSRPIPIDCVVLQHDCIDDCVTRCERRVSHETLAPRDARRVVGIVDSQFSFPGNEVSKIMKYRSIQAIPIHDNDSFQRIFLDILNKV